MKQAPWSRIRGQNSVNKEVWEMVGNGKPTGSVPKETVSVRISASVQKWHSRILRSRMWKMHREPEVLEARAQVGKWLDCRARTTSKELAPLHSVNNGILQNACSTSPKMDAGLWKSALVHTARLMYNLAKGLKRMVTKVQWLCWIVHDNWVAYSRIWSRRSLDPFCGRAQVFWSQSDVFDSTKQCYIMLTFETRIRRLEWFVQVILISVTSMLQNLRIGLKKRQNGKSDVPVKQRGGWQKYPKIRRRKIKQHSFHFRKIGVCLRHQLLNQRKENLL